MSKRKMCKWVTNACSGYGLREMLAKCPHNTNSRCEIVPRKAKPKMVKVKAWACFSYGDTCALTQKSGPYKIPCTILIEAKWLKGSKGL